MADIELNLLRMLLIERVPKQSRTLLSPRILQPNNMHARNSNQLTLLLRRQHRRKRRTGPIQKHSELQQPQSLHISSLASSDLLLQTYSRRQLSALRESDDANEILISARQDVGDEFLGLIGHVIGPEFRPAVERTAALEDRHDSRSGRGLKWSIDEDKFKGSGERALQSDGLNIENSGVRAAAVKAQKSWFGSRTCSAGRR